MRKINLHALSLALFVGRLILLFMGYRLSLGEQVFFVGVTAVNVVLDYRLVLLREQFKKAWTEYQNKLEEVKRDERAS